MAMKAFVYVLLATLFSGVAIADPPEASGIVTRGGYEGGWWWADEDTGLGVIIGTDIVALCSGTREFGFVAYSDKDIQDGLRLIRLEKGRNLVASVWPFTEFDCGRFLTELPLATGEVNRLMHDNDLYGPRYCDIKNNANAYGENFHGDLYSPTGEKRRFNGRMRGLYDCETDTFPMFDVKLLLTD